VPIAKLHQIGTTDLLDGVSLVSDAESSASQ
jgi:hypothetical protein